MDQPTCTVRFGAKRWISLLALCDLMPSDGSANLHCAI
jgi:hypothetical protein